MKVKFVLFPLLAVSGFIIWWYLAQPRQLQFGAQVIPAQGNYFIIAYGYLVTLAGVIIGCSYRQLQKLRDAGESNIQKPGLFLKQIASSIDLWMGIFGSPIVYALLWKSIDGGNISGLTVIALQNGFCCTLIISNFVATQGTTGQKAANKRKAKPIEEHENIV